MVRPGAAGRAQAAGAVSRPIGPDDAERAQRAAVALEVRRWRLTPYHERARVIGAGVDCGWLLIEVYSAVGLIEWFDPGYYAPDWHLHNDRERYVELIERFAVEYDPAERPIGIGDVVIWRYGRLFSHGGIVTGDPREPELTGWPWVVHALATSQFVEETYIPGHPLSHRKMRAFTLWPNGAR